jgi:tripartite-type tricarboxylate transporter receptor subunit TctC
MIRAICLALAVLGLDLGAAAFAQAQPQSFPERPIRLVVPFPAGGATDTSARIVAQGLSARLGQSVVIENQAGAGGTIGARQVARAAPDGYTLMMVAATNTFGTSRLLYKLEYDPLKVFVPVAMAVIDRQVLVATPALPVHTLDELVQRARTDRGRLSYGSANGIMPHFLMELFKIKAGIDILHVPYRGGAPMITDLLAGQIELTINGKSVLLPHIQAHELRPLAVTSAERWPELPDVPTMTEAGYLDRPYDTLFGLVAPAGTPVAVIRKLNAAVNEGLATPGLRASLGKLGIEPKTGSPEEFAAIIADDAPRWAEIVRLTGISLAE